MNRQRLGFNASLHGLRGLAVLMVFLFHVYDMSRKQGVIAEGALGEAGMLFFSGLQASVDVFFMISGYVILGSLYRHEASVRGIGGFLWSRVARIYPVFLLLHIALFTAAPFLRYKWTVGLSPGAWALHFLSNMFLLPGVFDLPLMQLNAWSLSYEWVFYLAASLSYLAAARHWRAKLLLVPLSLLVLAYPRMIFFAVGAGVFGLNREKNSLAERFGRFGLLAATPFFGCMALALEGEHNHVVLPGMRESLYVLAATPFAVVMFLGLVQGRAPLLLHPVMQFMGTISYSFYLWHAVVTFPLKLLMARLLVARWHMPAFAAISLFAVLSFALSLFVSYLSWRFLERGVGVWLARWGDPQKQRRVAHL